MRHTIWTTLELYKEFIQSQSTSSPLFAGFSGFLSSYSAVTGRKDVQAALNYLPSVPKSRFMSDHCWASGDICSLLPQTPFLESGH